MTRHSLRIVIVLGALITLLGGTGIFAVFSDRATTGSNDVTSGALGHAADLQLSTGDDLAGSIVCDGYDEDLATGFYSVSDLQPSLGDAYREYFCLKNVGSAAVNLTTAAIDLTDVDTDCTGDEAGSGDTTCGPAPTGQPANPGELSGVLTVTFVELQCDTATAQGQTGPTLLSDLASSPAGLSVGGITGRPTGDLEPGQVACYFAELRYPDSTPADAVQLAQSDTVTWRFAFDGTVPSN